MQRSLLRSEGSQPGTLVLGRGVLVTSGCEKGWGLCPQETGKAAGLRLEGPVYRFALGSRTGAAAGSAPGTYKGSTEMTRVRAALSRNGNADRHQWSFKPSLSLNWKLQMSTKSLLPWLTWFVLPW